MIQLYYNQFIYLMSLFDKFKIIENHLQNEDKTKVISKIENYFENLLNSDTHVLVSDYINQVIWFNTINANDFSINNDIKKYLIQCRNNMRIFIKKESFEFTNLNKFLKNFIVKIEYLNNVIKTPDNKIIKEGIKQLTNLIILDSLIMLFIEEQVVLLDKNLKSDIELLLNLTKILGKYDDYELFNIILKTIGNIYKRHLINMEEYPLPDNIKKIQRFYDNIKFCNSVKLYYSFIGPIKKTNLDFNILTSPIIYLIVQNLIFIIQSNTLDEIELMFNNIWNDFSILVTNSNFDDKENIFDDLSCEIINLIDKLLKEQSNINIFKIINSLKYFDLLVIDQDYKDIINQKISNVLSTDILMDQIHITINELILNNKIEETIKLLKFVINTKNKDIFIAKYYDFLTKRLMIKFSTNMLSDKFPNLVEESFGNYIYNEMYLCKFLINNFGDKLCYKINKVITDTDSSFFNNIEFNNISKNQFNNMSVITTSFNNWDINQTEGIVTNKIIDTIKETQLGNYLHNYNEYYYEKNSGKRIINWFPHFGEVSITYLNQQLIMLPIQFMVVEMFNTCNQIELHHIQNATFFLNYTQKFRNDIISSLVAAGMFKINSTSSSTEMILLNSQTIKTNLIEVFLNTSDYKSIWENNKIEELIHTREEIISSVINHILKAQSKTLLYDELFAYVKKSITLFELDDLIFTKTIDYMIKQDYIRQLENSSYEKIIY